MFDCKNYIPQNIQCWLASFEPCKGAECEKYNRCEFCRHNGKSIVQSPCNVCSNVEQKMNRIVK